MRPVAIDASRPLAPSTLMQCIVAGGQLVAARTWHGRGLTRSIVRLVATDTLGAALGNLGMAGLNLLVTAFTRWLHGLAHIVFVVAANAAAVFGDLVLRQRMHINVAFCAWSDLGLEESVRFVAVHTGIGPLEGCGPGNLGL